MAPDIGRRPEIIQRPETTGTSSTLGTPFAPAMANSGWESHERTHQMRTKLPRAVLETREVSPGSTARLDESPDVWQAGTRRYRRSPSCSLGRVRLWTVYAIKMGSMDYKATER
ncbi:hypothetical protein AAHC03_021140 [Spirometra sp. Aus1]